MKTGQAGLGSSQVATFCSESAGYSRLTTLSCHSVDSYCTYGVYCHVLRRATMAPMVFLSPLSLWIVLVLFGLFFLWPCLRAPGGGVPGFLAGLALVAVCVFTIHRSSGSSTVHMFHLQNGHRPNSRVFVQIFLIPSYKMN